MCLVVNAPLSSCCLATRLRLLPYKSRIPFQVIIHQSFVFKEEISNREGKEGKQEAEPEEKIEGEGSISKKVRRY